MPWGPPQPKGSRVWKAPQLACLTELGWHTVSLTPLGVVGTEWQGPPLPAEAWGKGSDPGWLQAPPWPSGRILLGRQDSTVGDRQDYELWDQASWSLGAAPATPSSRAARRDSGHAWPELARQPGKRRETPWSQQARWTRAAFLPSVQGLAQGPGGGQGKLMEQGGGPGRPRGEAAPVPRPSDTSASLAPLALWCPGSSILPTPCLLCQAASWV